jgi:ribose/xylose/arabinose/galactoside ABC-type transport system permease subunit
MKRSTLLVRQHALGLIVLGVALGFDAVAPHFLGLASLLEIAHVIAPLVLVSTGVALLILAGQLDLSVGSIAFVASAVFARMTHEIRLPWLTAALIAMSAGMLLGAVNAVLVVVLRVSSLISTLGTMIAFRGAGLLLTDGGLVELPEPVRPWGNAHWGPVFLDTLVALAIAVALHGLHRHSRLGRALTAIGNSVETSRRMGLSVGRSLCVAFVLSGLLAGLAGVLLTLQVGVNTAKIGQGLELTAIAVIVVGGVSLSGGRGRLLSAVLFGSLLFQIIRSGLQQAGVNPYAYRIVEGCVIFVAMYADALTRHPSPSYQGAVT